MNHIAQITLDKSIAVNRKLFGLYEWHKEAWKLFPGRPIDKREFLTRLDADEREFRFTVLSTLKPQKPDWCAQGWWREKEMPQAFFEQKRYLFKVTANPTRTLSRRDPSGRKKKNGSHYALTKPDELKSWFLKKSEQCGFRVFEEPVLEISKPVFHKIRKKEHEGTVVGVEFKGALEVINRENFLKAVSEGIGRARGFGFGLFVLKPIE